MCGIASGCKCFFKKPKLCICGTAFLLYTDKNLKDMEHWIHSHKFWVLVLIRRGSRGGEMGEFSPPPPLFFWALCFLFSLIPQILIGSITLSQKITLISKSWIHACWATSSDSTLTFSAFHSGLNSLCDTQQFDLRSVWLMEVNITLISKGTAMEMMVN